MAIHQIKIHYSPRDAGDGSCYVKFFKTGEGIAREVQTLEENNDGGFAEDCTGTLTIEFNDETGEINSGSFRDEDNE